MSWTHLADTKPKARKQYRCELCSGIIEAGDTHVARRGISEGKPITSRMHIYCESVSRKWDWSDWECYDPGEFRHWEIEDAGITDLNVEKRID